MATVTSGAAIEARVNKAQARVKRALAAVSRRPAPYGAMAELRAATKEAEEAAEQLSAHLGKVTAALKNAGPGRG
jgi:hypothetical protein